MIKDSDCYCSVIYLTRTDTQGVFSLAMYYMGKTFQFRGNECGMKLTSHKIILKDLSDLCLKRLKLEKKDYVKTKPNKEKLIISHW